MPRTDYLSFPLEDVVPDETGFVGGVEVGVEAQAGAQPLLTGGQQIVPWKISDISDGIQIECSRLL